VIQEYYPAFRSVQRPLSPFRFFCITHHTTDDVESFPTRLWPFREADGYPPQGALLFRTTDKSQIRTRRTWMRRRPARTMNEEVCRK